jgi:D-aminopeptidase
LPAQLGGYTVGVLVQTNFGGVLTMNGAPVGRELGRYYLKEELERAPNTPRAQASIADRADGSVIIVIATDAPVDARNLDRIATRALSGLARTGASMTNGSGDYVIAFSTHPGMRRPAGALRLQLNELGNDAMSGLFQAVVEATEEAIYNSLLTAETVSSRLGTVEALPRDKVIQLLRSHDALRR